MKHYVVTKKDDGSVVVVYYPTLMRVHGKMVPHIPFHSPRGLALHGSGVADLALTLLAHYMGESRRKVLAYVDGKGTACVAVIYHQGFKEILLSTWDEEMNEYTISSEEIHDLLWKLMKTPFVNA
jgi:hypothetical protein